jgi:FKBP-type peptidyl-prolyl cis-trans isomerase FklB
MRIAPLVLAAGLGLSLLQTPAAAAEEKAATFKDDKEKASYALGMWFGNQIKRSNMEVDTDVTISAMKDLLAGREPKLTDQQVQETLRNYQMESQRKVAEKNKKAGEAFLAENKSKPGVKTLEVTLPDSTKAEMQYKVITEGTGAIPKSNDTVTVNYRGTLIDGKEFDSSAKHGQPGKFMVNRVVKGWTEALERMKVGSKWEVYIPSALAYGDRGNPNIEPGSTLIFEVELLTIEPPQPTPTSQPLTSDIIKVPSADELKKGAKIEVIKPEDAARMAQEAQDKEKQKAKPETK